MTDLLRALRAAGWVAVVGLTAAAAAAIWVIVSSGEFEDKERVLASSLVFAAASATAAAGARATLRRPPALRVVGTLTIALSVIAFVLLEVELWGDTQGDTIARAFGCTAVAAIAGAHACLMLGSRKEGDTAAPRMLIAAAVALGAVDALGAILPLSSLVEDPSETYGKVFGSAFVLLLLTSVLPPLLRWLSRPVSGAKTAPEAV